MSNFLKSNDGFITKETENHEILYTLPFKASFPITRDSYNENRKEELKLEHQFPPEEQFFFSNTNRYMIGGTLIDDFVKFSEADKKLNLERGNLDLDVDYYTVEFDYRNNKEIIDNTIHNFINVEHSIDIDPETENNEKINIYVYLTDKNKETCFEKVKYLHQKMEEYGNTVLKNIKDLTFEPEYEKNIKKAANFLGKSLNEEQTDIEFTSKTQQKPQTRER